MRYWSDYNRVFYHPRSIVQLYEYELNSSLLPFERYEAGEELFANTDREEDVLDRDLRLWAEECDQIQAIQMLSGADDAWAGFASKYIQRLRDEFGKMSIWMWGFGEEQGKGLGAKQALRMLNAAQVVAEVSENATMYVPVSVPGGPLPGYLQLDKGSQWHTSALLSAAFETITLPTRLRSDRPGRQLDNIEVALNVNGNQRIAQLQCSLIDLDETTGSLPSRQKRNAAGGTSNTSRPLTEEDDAENDKMDLDIDLSATQFKTGGFRPLTSSNHLFGGFECLRGNINDRDDELGDDGDDVAARSEKRSRPAGVPVIQRWAVLVTDCTTRVNV